MAWGAHLLVLADASRDTQLGTAASFIEACSYDFSSAIGRTEGDKLLEISPCLAGYCIHGIAVNYFLHAGCMAA